ncbi:MAG: hypothetical protein HOQ05_00290 [Corynebacteriales bacterium]|nr:hypothetical protein [Mycobacteriales bacterium]
MELSFLRPLYEVPGPVLSVHLDTSREDQDADKRIEIVWQGLKRDLQDQGADLPTLNAIEQAVGGSPDLVGAQGEALFAADGQLLAVHTLAAPPTRNRATAGPVADALETALDRDRQLPYVVVAIDRQGAEIDGYALGAFDPTLSRSFNGSTLHITRVKTGGPSKASYHRRTQNLWDRNAAAVAEEIVDAVNAVDAAVVFVGGDDKATAALRDQPAVQGLDVEIVDISGGRGGQDAVASLRKSLDDGLAAASQRAHNKAFQEYASAIGTGSGVSSIPTVADALAEGRVGTLLLSANIPQSPSKWSSDRSPLMVASSAHPLDDNSAFEMPAPALLLRAATLSNSNFTEIPADQKVTDGCGATLRF